MIICTRKLMVEGQGSNLIISIASPKKVSDEEWRCDFKFTGSESVRGHACGIDGVQALYLAFECIANKLNSSNRKFSWVGGQKGDHGCRKFVPFYLGSRIAKKIEKALDRIVDSECHAVIRRGRQKHPRD